MAVCKLRSLIVSFVATIPLFAGAYSTSYYASTSNLSTGRWVKVSVSSTGIHQISYDSLREFGFENPEKVAVFGYGGARMTSNAFDTNAPDDLAATPVCHTEDGRILFYGEADLSISAASVSQIDARRNVYDTKGYYFLTDSREPALVEPRSFDYSEGTPVSHHLSVAYVENEAQNPADGGAVFHDVPFEAGEVRNYEFDICDFETTSEYAYGRLSYSFAALSDNNTSLLPVYPSTLSVISFSNGNAGLQTQDTKFYSTGSGLARISRVKVNGKHIVGFGVSASCSPTYAAMDWAAIVYPRCNSLGGAAELLMNVPLASTGDCVEITNAGKDIEVWDVSDAARVTPCSLSYSVEGSVMYALMPSVEGIGSASRRIIAFNKVADFPEVQFVGDVDNQDLHSSAVPEMVIITTDELVTYAEELASLHREYDGLDVAVVPQHAIFNEFSSGSRAAMAYRRYLKMLYDKDPSRLRYVLFYGHGTWDNRRSAAQEQLVCYETEVVDQARDRTKNFSSDKYFAMLEDNFNASRIPFGKMSIAVGRLDLSSGEAARRVNSKIERFLQRGRSHAVYGNVLVFSDDGDDQGHFKDAENAVSAMAAVNPTLTFTRAHNLIYPWDNNVSVAGRQAISLALKSGQGLMLYCGHCTHIALTGEKLYDINLIDQTSYDDYPFAMLASCETFGFDRSAVNLAPSMLSKTDGGAVGIIGSCRTVYMEYNRTFAEAVAVAYASATPETAIGDVLKDAHNYSIAASSEADRAINNMCYNLCGDPALKIGAPGYQIIVDGINGKGLLDGEGSMCVDALSKVRIEGHVTDNGALVDGFNGDAEIRIYDSPYVVETLEKDGKDPTRIPVTLDEDVLASAVVPVIAGQFVAELTCPIPLNGDGVNRMTISAVAHEGDKGAAGMSKVLQVQSEGVVMPDEPDAPEILTMYIDTPVFSEGDVVGSSVVVYADIRVPESGLNLSSGIGSAPSLSLDGKLSYTEASRAMVLNADGTATFGMRIEDLSDGLHDLTLTVKSNSGGAVSRTVGFVVQDGSVSAVLKADDILARKSVIIELEHNLNELEPYCRLIVEDAQGNTVYSVDNCRMPFEWNLKDKSGNDVPDGLYRVYALLRDDMTCTSTPKLGIVVIR